MPFYNDLDDFEPEIDQYDFLDNLDYGDDEFDWWDESSPYSPMETFFDDDDRDSDVG